ncbi:MAG: hypothetical protein TRG1_1695 [Flavobacteriaceae bacterium FS1-H7996/R]|nr:MAG: hypothetical protein TRG1_1695 [Flavobacteriaceae bacterium FS1-H7996/R]
MYNDLFKRLNNLTFEKSKKPTLEKNHLILFVYMFHSM